MITRTAGTSFDPELFDEVQKAIRQLSGEEQIEADQLGMIPEDEAEANYLRGQEMALVVASPCWNYIKEALKKMVSQSEQLYRDAETDEEILRRQREWKAMEKAVKSIISNVETSAQVPHPNAII